MGLKRRWDIVACLGQLLVLRVGGGNLPPRERHEQVEYDQSYFTAACDPPVEALSSTFGKTSLNKSSSNERRTCGVPPICQTPVALFGESHGSSIDVSRFE